MGDSEFRPPHQEQVNATAPQRTTSGEHPIVPPVATALTSHAAPAPHEKKYTQTCRPDQSSKAKQVFEALAITAAVFASIVYFFQLNAILESNDINRQSLQSVQRALMAFDGVGNARLTKRLQSGQEAPTWVFQSKWTNNGPTPAIEVVSRFEGNRLPHGLSEEDFVGSEKVGGLGVIAPRTGTTVGEIWKDDDFIFGERILDWDNITSIEQPKNTFFWGWMVYRDVFTGTKLHLTEACQRLDGVKLLNPKGKPAGSEHQIQLMFVNCEEHNCTDEYCKDYEAVIDRVSR
jgi:hypothetical protein